MSTPKNMSFLPDDYLERKAQRRANTICGMLFVLVLGGVCSAFWLSEQATRKLDGDSSRTDQQYLVEAKRLEQVREMQEKQRRMAHQAELTASLLERVPRSFLLAEFTNSMPAGVSLLDLAMESKARAKSAEPVLSTAYEQKKAAQNQAAKGAAKGPALPPLAEPRHLDVNFKLTGMAHTDVQVAQFINKLDRSKFLKDVNLVISEEFTQNKQSLRKFVVDMTLDPSAEITVDAGRSTANTAIETK